MAIELKAASLNHLDLWLASGAQRMDPPRVICADGVGVVADSADPRWKSGDEVVVYPVACCWDCEYCRSGEQVKCEHFGILGEHVDGTACELLHVPGQNVYAKPARLAWHEAAAFPLTFLTAWRMLVTRARLRRGETMLVVGAGAGVATAAMVIGRQLGARVLATSRSPAKRAKAEALGAEATFESAGFAKSVRQFCGGVDVVFEHVGPATIDESMKSLRKGGRLVFCGATSGPKAELNLPRIFFNHLDLLGSTMGNAAEFEQVLSALDQGMRPLVDSSFPLAQVSDALRYLDGGEQFGKVVLDLDS
ncbi:MAG: zinc-binding dehydrogenase [Candidatus Dormibacteraeota bacterium]|uniref:Zinc-binding dehydrogenase n=1 Tax=Candidatus Dormiibacter inghamiae TaxID=3127013 RepID=A0A934KBU8_9BACT|nr:zinc-binding dehydrogenase [Candidatus Dormibacteraeota bacterium]MBJ7606993.1 zinc-binding dehydrogenase [Candidatus Dormibacteraeota bacterium]